MQDFLKQIIKEAGIMAKGYFDQGVTFTTKSHLGDLLTIADTTVSKFLVDKIHAKYPDHKIHSEEMPEDVNPGAEYEWVIDPIDGTRNFAMGIPMWCHLIAILKDGELYMAVVHNPIANELFFAKAGEGANMNGMPIKVNEVDSLDHAFGIISRSSVKDYCDLNKIFGKIINKTTSWIHSFGTMLSTCYVATGGADYALYNCGMDHDYLAPALICREAGALVTNEKGEPWTRYDKGFIVANPKLHPKLIALFK